MNNVFRPERFGDFSRPLEGQMFLKDETYSRKVPDFHLQYMLKSKQERKAERQRRKRQIQLKKDIVVRTSIAPPNPEEEVEPVPDGHVKPYQPQKADEEEHKVGRRKNKPIVRETQAAIMVEQLLKE